jgi:electron transfer flavoprotein beta subunit
MKAKSKPLKESPLAEILPNYQVKTSILKLDEPPKRKGGVKVETVQDLVAKLKNEAKVL